MEKYESYKDSGEKWLGLIPSHWQMMRWRFLMEENTKQNTDGRITCQLQFKYGEIVPKANQDVDKDVLETISKYTVVAPGDIMINGLNLNYDFISQRIGQVKENGVITSAYISLRPTSVANRKYLVYLLKSMDSQKLFHGMGTGVRLTLSYKELKNKFLPVPSCEEQSNIVAYLDEQCSKIDEAIAQQQKMIDLLNERKQIIINNAVTKGLNPNIAMKESGIKWVGHIPSSWQIRSLKRTAKVILGKMLENEYGNKKGYPYLCAKDVHFNSINTDNLKTMLFSEEERSKYKVQKGDLLVVEGGAGGTCAIVKDDINEVYIQNSLMIVRCNEQIATNSYLSYYLQMLMQKGYADSVCNKATIMHFTKEKLCDVPVILPSISQQKYIVEFLDNQLLKIDMVINSLEARKSLLTERKQIIINEVVTGKVKV